jgi:hypothetical protein
MIIGFVMKKHKKEELAVWKSYISENKKNIITTIINNLKPLRFPIDENAVSVMVNEFSEVGRDDSFWLMKFIVEPGEFVKMRARFRGYKYRKNSNYTKIGISTYALNKLNQIKHNNDFANLDDVLEYLITEREYYNTLPSEAITNKPNDINNPVSIERRLEWLIQRLNKDDVDIVKSALEAVFLDAWGKAKLSRSRKKDKATEDMNKQPLVNMLP